MSDPAILAELKKLGKQLTTICNLVHGLYRHSKGAPVQPPLPGLVADDSPMPEPGAIARSLPRRWSNTVKVYEALYERWGKCSLWFTLSDLADKRFLADVHVRTNGRVGFASMSKILSVLRRAGALRRGPKGELTVEEPTDEIRERIEAAVSLSNAHRPKEAADA